MTASFKCPCGCGARFFIQTQELSSGMTQVKIFAKRPVPTEAVKLERAEKFSEP